jgi:hypothetical protein
MRTLTHIKLRRDRRPRPGRAMIARPIPGDRPDPLPPPPRRIISDPMNARPTRPVLGNRSARNLFLARHALSEDPRRKQSPGDLLSLIERIGFVQVDSINTVARAHDMILFARNQTYRPDHLRTLLEHDRELFENWTHDAAIIPARFFPYWLPRFARGAARIRDRWSGWHRPGFIEMLDEIRAHVRRDGPVMAREVGTDAAKSNGGWWDWHPSKTALEYLWRTGELAICRREGFQKVYDLTSRVIPARHRRPPPDEEAFIDWACASALDRLGFATSGEIAAFWDSVTPAEAAAWCERHRGSDLIEVEVEPADGSKPRRAFARPDLPAEARDAPPPPGRLRILSPFDPALRDRKRTERLFGFHYRIEVFVPAPKRKYGYYVFPILEGNRLTGRIDMKCDRDAGALTVAGLWLEPGVGLSKRRAAALEAELDRYRRFTGCGRVAWAPGAMRAAGGPVSLRGAGFSPLPKPLPEHYRNTTAGIPPRGRLTHRA